MLTNPKYLGFDLKIAELKIVSETVAELKKNIREKIDAKGKEFWRQEYRKLQQFPNEEERKKMQSKDFEKTRDAFVKEKTKNFEDLDNWVLNNYFDVRQNYPSIELRIKKYIDIKVDKFKKILISIDEIRTGVAENYDRKVLSQLRWDDIESMKNFSKNYIVNSKKEALDKLYKRKQELISADNSSYLEFFNNDRSIYKKFIEQYCTQIIAEVRQEIHQKILLKVNQIRNNFNCKALFLKVQNETLSFVEAQISRRQMQLDQIKSNAESMAKDSFQPIEDFISINVPDLESVKNEELINRSKIGYRDLKDKVEKDLNESIDNEINQHLENLRSQELNKIWINFAANATSLLIRALLG